MEQSFLISLITRGGTLMVPLLLCSVIAFAVVIERSIFWISTNAHRNKSLIRKLLKLIESGDLKDAEHIAASSKDYIAKVFYEGLKDHGTALQPTFDRAVSEQMGKMRKHLSILDTIIAIAPLLGILGTVVGIIQSFDLLGAAGIEDPKSVTAGIGQALITTATGLTIAILSMLPYNWFNRKLEKVADEYTDTISRFEVALKKGLKKEKTTVIRTKSENRK